MELAKKLHWINIVGMSILIIGVILFALMDMWWMSILTFAVALFTVLSWAFFD